MPIDRAVPQLRNPLLELFNADARRKRAESTPREGLKRAAGKAQGADAGEIRASRLHKFPIGG